MKRTLSPSPIFTVILILALAAFFIGTLQLFHPANAAPLAGSAGARAAEASQRALPTPTREGSGIISADTAGIIALVIVIVTTVLTGSAWGLRSSNREKKPRK